MNAGFKEIIDKLPMYMERLNECEFYERGDLKGVPKKGIYVFYEEGKPLYVGRSENMRSRLKRHSLQSSGHNSATFAFILAKEIAEASKIDIKKFRKNLETDEQFKPIYQAQKDRVSRMKIKTVSIDNAVEQTFFEVYAAMELKTKYNEWGTH